MPDIFQSKLRIQGRNDGLLEANAAQKFDQSGQL